jgi:hypothetical protein
VCAAVLLQVGSRVVERLPRGAQGHGGGFLKHYTWLKIPRGTSLEVPEAYSCPNLR